MDSSDEVFEVLSRHMIFAYSAIERFSVSMTLRQAQGDGNVVTLSLSKRGAKRGALRAPFDRLRVTVNVVTLSLSKRGAKRGAL